jgi:hypothetical protein
MTSNLDWINDKLHDIIGMSESHLVNYIHAIGKFYIINFLKQISNNNNKLASIKSNLILKIK